MRPRGQDVTTSWVAATKGAHGPSLSGTQDLFPAPSRTSLKQSLCRSVTPDTLDGVGLLLGGRGPPHPTPHPAQNSPVNPR